MSISWLTINAPNYGSYNHCTWIPRQWKVIDFIDLQLWVVFVLLECENGPKNNEMSFNIISLGGMRLFLNIIIVMMKTRIECSILLSAAEKGWFQNMIARFSF